MHPFPHNYTVTASLSGKEVVLHSPGLKPIHSASPAEFGGPGNLWSPETLFTAAVADCFILTFKAIAYASRLSWENLDCHVNATLNRMDKLTRFTEILIIAKLTIDEDTSGLAGIIEKKEKAMKLLHKAESTCLITNSLTARVIFEPEVATRQTAASA